MLLKIESLNAENLRSSLLMMNLLASLVVVDLSLRLQLKTQPHKLHNNVENY
jgi:hypothetical protein